jgi:AcrR family transcriptional regulator
MVSRPKTAGISETKAGSRRRKLRDALVDAAERTIEAEGLRGLKARELAYKVGCAVGAIYNVVTDLDDLIYAVNARTLAQLEAQLTEAGATVRLETEGIDGALDRLVRLALAYTDFAAAHTQRWRAVFDHQPQPGRNSPDWYMADQLRLFGYVEEPLKALRPHDAPQRRALIARSLVSAVHGIVVLGLEEKLQLLPRPVLREQVTLLVAATGRGLAAQAAK